MSNTTVKLNYINQSNDANNSEIVIFQKNVVATYDEIAIAWKVIKNCGFGSNHPFDFPLALQVAASDSWGNYTPKLDAYPGDQFAMVRNTSGDVLQFNGPANSSEEVEVLNMLPRGAIDACIYRNGKLLAQKTNVAPQQMAAFKFKPSIWVGVVSQIEEGQVMDSAILSAVNTEFSLLGVAAADIVLTGGGPGPDSTAFTFEMKNVKTL
jgi:hypothetical protein